MGRRELVSSGRGVGGKVNLPLECSNTPDRVGGFFRRLRLIQFFRIIGAKGVDTHCRANCEFFRPI